MLSVKRAIRQVIVQFFSRLVGLRLGLLSSRKPVKGVCFVNVNNYPSEHFIKIIKAQSPFKPLALHDVYDTWNALIKTPWPSIKAVASSSVVVAAGESPIFHILRKDQVLVYIWHACGAFKRMGKTAKTNHTRPPDWIIVSSEGVRPKYAEAFGLPLERVVALGVPRTEIFQDKIYIQKIIEDFLKRYRILSDKKVYLYVPTYKEEPFRSETGFDLKIMSSLLAEDEVLIYKQHPAVIREVKKGRAVSNFFPMHNIICMDDEDVLKLTMLCDVIMTDYSSAFFEAMLMDKPCVFCATDVDSYEKGYYLDYRRDLPGTVIESGKAEDVIHALRTASINHPNYQSFKEHHLGACTGDISGRVAAFLKELEKIKQ